MTKQVKAKSKPANKAKTQSAKKVLRPASSKVSKQKTKPKRLSASTKNKSTNKTLSKTAKPNKSSKKNILKTKSKPIIKLTKKITKTQTPKKPLQPRKAYTIKTGEEYMNEEQLKHFENLLLLWKEELLREAEITVQDMQATSANFPDPVDRASQEEEFNLELRTRDRERKLLKKIGEALQRIKESNYGYCNDCGAEIGVRRLEARPTATQCIECKTIAEIREKQVGDIGKEKEEE
jgi:DnaK suppressor protein